MEPQNISTPTGKKVMIIEDEAFIAEIYARELTKAGFTVKTASDGVSGLEELNKDSFDILLLDILLPNMHGLEVLKQWKSKNPKSTMKVLLLTNLGQDEVIQEAFKLGANGYLIKASYTPKQVVNIVSSILNGTPFQGTPQTPPIPAPVPAQQPAIDPTAPIVIDQPVDTIPSTPTENEMTAADTNHTPQDDNQDPTGKN